MGRRKYNARQNGSIKPEHYKKTEFKHPEVGINDKVQAADEKEKACSQYVLNLALGRIPRSPKTVENRTGGR